MTVESAACCTQELQVEREEQLLASVGTAIRPTRPVVTPPSMIMTNNGRVYSVSARGLNLVVLCEAVGGSVCMHGDRRRKLASRRGVASEI